ncbi:MAG: transglycosylase SLT domain-containing protein [Nitrospirae bacterium]|nr:transglycosylase SLT domain-containing protein [Nitrospirota bacterium]
MKKGHRDLLFLLLAVAIFPVLTGLADASALPEADKEVLEVPPEAGQYSELLSRLVVETEKAGMLGDYLLFLSARRAYATGKYRQSLADADEFLHLYRDSYLARDVRLLKIKAMYEILSRLNPGTSTGGCFGSDAPVYASTLKVMEDYIRDYPYDQEVLYLYAKTLERAGMETGAEDVFRSLYIRAGRYYAEVKEKVSPDDLTTDEVVLMSRNLRRALRLKESEALLLGRLDSTPENARKPLYASLADTYFRMKDYRNAAFYYQKAGNIRKAAISYYRSGDYDLFDNMLRLQQDEKTAETCSILLLKGLKKRRDLDFDDALEIFRTAYRDYPCQEESLWHIAWTEYLMGNFLSASYNFRDLYAAYKRPAYLYWQARSLERLGQNAKRLYSSITGDPLYTVLGRMRSGGVSLTSAGRETANPQRRDDLSFDGYTINMPRVDPVELGDLPYTLSLTLRRAELLNGIGLRKYAVREVYSYKPAGDGERLKVCRYLQSLGAFRESFRCASRLKMYPEVSFLLYPAVYGDIVSEISSDYNVNPFLILSVMREESRFNREAVSRAGALGLMQLMPYTARRMAKSIGYDTKVLSDNGILDPEVNITLGSYYLGLLLREFGSVPVAVAAYNAGENAVRRWLKAYQYGEVDEFIEDIPYRETRLYVKKVLRSYFRYLDVYGQKR